MKCLVVKDDVLESILRAEKVTGKNHTLPILSCVLLHTQGNILTITATNLEVGVAYQVPIQGSEDGVVAVSGSVLVQVITTLPSHTQIQFTTTQGFLIIESAGMVSKLAIQNTEEFPALPHVEQAHEVQLPSKTLSTAIEHVSFCASNSTIKPELSSVYIHPDGSTLITAATDSFRLAEKKVPLQKAVSAEPFLIPIRSIPDVVKFLESAPEYITLHINNHQLSVTTETAYLTLRLVSGTFPDYTQIIPKEYITEITTLRFDIERILRRAAVFTDQFNQTTLDIKPKKKKCSIYTQHTTVGETTDELTITGTGEDLTIRFNQRYLLDSLHSITTDSILLQFGGQSQPAIVRPVGDTTYIYLVMPMNR
jgi:DNA polymerase-3 subunit beta